MISKCRKFKLTDIAILGFLMKAFKVQDSSAVAHSSPKTQKPQRVGQDVMGQTAQSGFKDVMGQTAQSGFIGT